MLIKEIKARRIKDSRNEDTIEVDINGQRASSPSGKSKGKYETPSYHKNIDWNIKAINSLRISFEINSFSDLKKIESYLKKQFKLKNAKEFGANALYALESVILKTLAKEQNKELFEIINIIVKDIPVPVGNVIGGGLHSHFKNHPVFQEFLLIPNEKSFKENFEMMTDVYESLGRKLKTYKINDEGAWECSLDEEQVLELLSSYKDVGIGIDVASSSFLDKGKYKYKETNRDKDKQIDYINYLIQKFGIYYMEDPLHEKDFKGFSEINKTSRNLIVGDDLTATHKDRLKKAIKENAINAMIIKPNQNGSLIELKEIFEICRKNKIKTVMSHRSGETFDNALADYAVGFGADFIKCGIATKWREVKLNRLLEIEKILDKRL